MPLNKDYNKIWKQALDQIKLSISVAAFSTWFAKTFITNITKKEDRQIVEIGCPSSYVVDALERRYFGLIQSALNSVTGIKNELLFVVRQKQDQASDSISDQPLFSTTLPKSSQEFEEALRRAKIRPGFTFENFAVSSTNQMAHAAAEAVATKIGSYNPLFIWGGVGVGKTHLMLAIAHKVLQMDPSLPCLYCMGEEFTSEIVQAIRYKTTDKFKDKYRKLKLLLIDDVQFIAGKERVQEEFFHTFNIIQRDGGQIILTSDKPPSEIQNLEARIQSRFEAGLVVDIAPPDFELRAAIALIKAQQHGFDLPVEVAQLIAEHCDTPRKIEGLIIKLSTLTNINGQTITSELVERMLNKESSNKTSVKFTTPEMLINAVAQYYSLGKKKLLGSCRARSFSYPRQILMYMLRKEMGLGLVEIGRIVGGRDHTTVIHAVEKISHDLSINSRLREDIMGIKKIISV